MVEKPYVDEKPYDNPKKYGAYGKRNDYKDKGSVYGKEDVSRLNHIKPADPEYEPQNIKKEKIISSRMIQNVGDDKIKPLKLISAEVIGGIFDRVKFLETRIDELRGNIVLRKQIHDSMLSEIQKDIEDREQFMQVVSDINEKRNLKLDISVLRKERRNEDVQFWRDLVELDTELKKMEEEFQIETKIAGIFDKIKEPS